MFYSVITVTNQLCPAALLRIQSSIFMREMNIEIL